MTNKETTTLIREILSREKFTLSEEQKQNGQTGVDIIATKNGESFYIEVIGYKERPPARSKDFYESIFRSLSRLDQGAKHCIVALPNKFTKGMSQRINNGKEFYKRLFEEFHELEFWFISEDGGITKYSGKNLFSKFV
jgi:hypothetical protein